MLHVLDVPGAGGAAPIRHQAIEGVWSKSLSSLLVQHTELLDQKYLNEIMPIFYYGKSPKTNRKHLKIPDLQALTLGRVKKITLY